MSNLSVFDFNSNNIRFENRGGRVWVSLTDMAVASGKRMDNWKRLQATTEFLTELKHSLTSELMVNNVGGTPATTGTWAIEEVALEFAGWCSVKFKIWMLQQIKTLVTTGTVSLPQVEQPQLPPNKVALEISRDVREITDNLTDNPRLAQFLVDHAISGIMPSQATLTGDSLQGVVEIAEEMGMKVNMSNRSQLGKFVKARCGELSQQEKRLVNGTMREVACYPVNNLEVRQAIQDFFA